MAGVAIQQLLEQALGMSSVDGCIVIGEEHTEANLRWATNSLTTNGQTHYRKLSVISVVHTPEGTKSGVVSGPVTGADPTAELSALVKASEDAARAASPAEDAAPLVEAYPHDDDWDSPAAHTGIEVFTDFAPALGRAFQAAKDGDRLLYGFAEHILSSAFLATSTGIRRRYDQYTGRLELNARSADLSRTAWIGQQTQDFSDIDIEAMAAEVAQRLEWSRNQIELPAGRYETLLPPSAVADLMVFVFIGASARDAEEGRNAYSGPDGSTKLGTAISPRPLNLYSDPAAPGMQCAPFQITPVSSWESVFDNGAPLGETRWISEGKLANLYRNRNWAARTGAEHVSLTDNLTLDETRAGGSPAPTLDEMIAGTKRGLLLTCLWYLRQVDPQTMLVTGSTRDGVYLIEDGVVTGEVNNFRFNESPVDLLGRVTEVGETKLTLSREWSDNFTRTAMPSLRVPDFNMSTVSQAS